ALFVLALFLLGRGKPRLSRRLLAFGLTAAVSAGSFVLLYADGQLYATLAGDRAGDQRQAYAATGLLYPFLHSAGAMLTSTLSY
ncbi:hypothetical protein RFZ03_01395, partial [Acinetobacter baumannii]|nr:hypothetical protein [Acinetobacter baumannii]